MAIFNTTLPTLPALSRPSWAPAWMTEDTIRDVRRNPKQLYGYKSGMFSQQNFNGSLAGPQAGAGAGGLLPGTVTAEQLTAQNAFDPYSGMPMASNVAYPGQTGTYVAPQGIPGTATNWTLDNPGPNAPPRGMWTGPAWASQRGAPGVPSMPGPAPAVVQKPTWFQNPWQTQAKADTPFWMKGFNYGT